MRTPLLAAAAVLVLATQCLAGETFNLVMKRGLVRCGVSDNTPGFSLRSPDGAWSGMDVDFCRAVAAAMTGDPSKVQFVPLSSTARFTALIAREVDLLARHASWTLQREAMLGLSFIGPLAYTGMGFVVARERSGDGLEAIRGANVCVLKGTTHERNITVYSAEAGLAARTVTAESVDQALEKLFSGQCDAFAEDALLLESHLARHPERAAKYKVVTGQFSRELLSPVARADDGQWLMTLVSVRAALINAEDAGITAASLATPDGLKDNPRGRVTLARTESVSKALGLTPGWATRAITAVGNYGEMFERNLGKQGPLKLDRGVNQLWSRGGLIQAPPF